MKQKYTAPWFANVRHQFMHRDHTWAWTLAHMFAVVYDRKKTHDIYLVQN